MGAKQETWSPNEISLRKKLMKLYNQAVAGKWKGREADMRKEELRLMTELRRGGG